MKSKFFSIFFTGFPEPSTYWAAIITPKACPFLAKEKEQAEVGRSPTLLAICAANGVWRILRGYFTAFRPVRKRKKDTSGYPV